MLKEFLNFLSPSSDVEKTALVRDVWINSTPEQYILWNKIMSKYKPYKIEALALTEYWVDPDIGTQFITYTPGVEYVALQLDVFGYPHLIDDTVSSCPSFYAYDEIGVSILDIQATYPVNVLSPPAASPVNWVGREIHLKNIYFASCAVQYMDTFVFIGYKIFF